MRRWLLVAALGAAFLTSSMWAQRRGGGGGFAGHGGSAGGVSHGSISGGHGTLAGGFGPAPGGSSWAGRGGGWSYPYGWNYPRYGSYWRGYPYYQYGRWGYYGLWYGYPGWGFDWSVPDSYPAQSYIYEPPPDNYAQEQAARQQAELDELHDEVARLREQRQTQTAPPVTTNVSEQTELVFRDQHTEKIENYAIVGQTLWVFNEQRARKVALADVDVAATKQANEARGVEFNLPR